MPEVALDEQSEHAEGWLTGLTVGVAIALGAAVGLALGATVGWRWRRNSR
jgi:predicted MFS family arabinose efflux permease